MATKKASPKASSGTAKVTKLEKDLKSLETRVKKLEQTALSIPSSAEFTETRNRIVKWAQENTLAALGVAILIGLFIGGILM